MNTIKLSELIGDINDYSMLVKRFIGTYNDNQRQLLINYIQSSIDYSAPEQVVKVSAHKKLRDAVLNLPPCDTFTIVN